MPCKLVYVLMVLVVAGCGRSPDAPANAPAPGATDTSTEQPAEPDAERSTGERRSPTVTALRFRTWISTGGLRRLNEGTWEEALWFPEWKLEARTWTEGHPPAPRLAVHAAEFQAANSRPGLAFVPPGEDERAAYQGPTERVEVPRALAESIRDAYERRATWEAERDRAGAALAGSGPLREVPDNLAEDQVGRLAVAIWQRANELKRLPDSLDDLHKSRDEGLHELLWEVPHDPWGRAFVYRVKDHRSYTVRSSGADGIPDTDDDIGGDYTR